MLPLIQAKVVYGHGWLTQQEFTDIVAISQMTPGPIGINTATFVGYTTVQAQGYGQLACTLGSTVSTLAVVLPSFLIVLTLCHIYQKFHKSAVFTGTMDWLKPCVAGLIGAAAFLLVTPENFIDWGSWVILAASFILAMWTSVHPILILLMAGLAGWIIY